jgi:hypothetical protein
MEKRQQRKEAEHTPASLKQRFLERLRLERQKRRLQAYGALKRDWVPVGESGE